MSFTIAVHQYERDPYTFRRDGRPVQLCLLPAGHYSILGHESKVAVARKTLDGLFAACGYERDQFVQELDKLAAVPSAHLVIETTLGDVLYNPPLGTHCAPKSVYGSVISWAERTGVIPWFASDRQLGERTTHAILDRWYRDHVLGEHGDSIYRRARRQAKQFLGV